MSNVIIINAQNQALSDANQFWLIFVIIEIAQK